MVVQQNSKMVVRIERIFPHLHRVRLNNLQHKVGVQRIVYLLFVKDERQYWWKRKSTNIKVDRDHVRDQGVQRNRHSYMVIRVG